MENWQSAETQKDIEQLMSAYGDFHDACIVSLNFQSGAFVDDKKRNAFWRPGRACFYPSYFNVNGNPKP